MFLKTGKRGDKKYCLQMETMASAYNFFNNCYDIYRIKNVNRNNNYVNHNMNSKIYIRLRNLIVKKMMIVRRSICYCRSFLLKPNFQQRHNNTCRLFESAKFELSSWFKERERDFLWSIIDSSNCSSKCFKGFFLCFLFTKRCLSKKTKVLGETANVLLCF